MRDDPSSSNGPLRRHGLNGLLAAFLVGMVGFLILGPERVTLVAPQFLFFFGAALLAWRALWRRAWWRALAWTAAGVAWIYYYHDANKWLQSLGSDSFAETTAPTFEEFWFWLKTMGQILQPSLRPWTAAIFVAVVAALITLIEVVALIARVPRPGRHHRVGQFAKLVLVASIVSFFARSVMAYAENTSMQDKITANFAAPAGLAAVARRPLDVVVYIGESTTMMHWGLYGYPRRTTPELAKVAAEDPGLLVFRNVFSTHTHTSQSLFEALSVAARAGEEGLPITDRHRVSVADILMAAGVRTTLYSNQGRAGTFNMMAPVIFGKAPQIYSAETRLAGNMDVNVEKPFDDAFFAGTGVRAVKEGPAPSVTFLHSNAGHGPYLSRLPESFRKPVDDLLAGAAPEAVVGQGAGLVADVEEYDTAMAYVDHNVAAQLRDVAALPRPTVLIYFSDHGEAPGDRRGHESSRFLHEMMRVPFLVYFNEAARQAEPRLFARYQALAAAGQPASLAQFPATLFDLLDLAVTGGLPAGGADLPAVGNAAILPPVLVRGLGRGPSALVDLNGQPQRGGSSEQRHQGQASQQQDNLA
jgi:glucan phosphoethanolaminetransferase (alkaline phosphatase superfamily)